MSSFQLGQLVALKSNPNKLFPIIEILPASSEQVETRYRVFVDDAVAIYY